MGLRFWFECLFILVSVARLHRLIAGEIACGVLSLEGWSFAGGISVVAVGALGRHGTKKVRV
ncbi:hypothetical protein Lal_00019694 [Lupinus albus]|nr:hypothetical protein Lal_00019694 [Lupinus albus]